MSSSFRTYLSSWRAALTSWWPQKDEDIYDDPNDPLLYGWLNVKIEKAENLPDVESGFFDILGKISDTYVMACLGESVLFKTKHISNNPNPTWDEEFFVNVCHQTKFLRIFVKDRGHAQPTEFICSCEISCSDLMSGNELGGWFRAKTDKEKEGGRILISSLKYTPKGKTEKDKAMSDTYFEAKPGNYITLYQDADTPKMPIFNGIKMPAGGGAYKVTSAWKDIYSAINEATTLIYIIGWSLNYEIQLLRGSDDPTGTTKIGGLLKRKAAQGVKVLVMLWDEMTATDQMPAYMDSKNQETYFSFIGTPVEVVLMPRLKTHTFLENEMVRTLYSHHQKTVICDAPSLQRGKASTGQRRLVAFIGGLDFSNGKYDNPEHKLFDTLKSLHKNDFRNRYLSGALEEVGPREPWHDTYAKVEGPVVWDLHQNFVERWTKQAEEKALMLCNITPKLFDREEQGPNPREGGGQWQVQVFRSITSDSVNFDRDRLMKCTVHTRGPKVVENSILRALIYHVRNASHFIYIENSFFVGSSYSWFRDRWTSSHHPLHREITQKICDKIKKGESFRVYVLIPMYPEGDPHGKHVQEVLYFQYRSIEAMYRRIAMAIKDKQLKTHPLDYLMFFCLAKREATVPEGLAAPQKGSSAENIRKTIRFPVNVHSKVAIFDDDYILIGSYNLNQRSLGGDRDTEIAIGAWQPNHVTATEGNTPRGAVHSFRMALWAEHFGGTKPAFDNPASQECVIRVKSITKNHWADFTAERPRDCQIMAMPYPYSVDKDGMVKAPPEPWDCFPDTKASVVGKASGFLPEKLNT